MRLQLKLSVFFSKDFRRKLFDLRTPLPPCVRGQSGLSARVLEKLFARPAILAGNLREKQASLMAARDDETITAGDDLVDRAHRLDRPHHRDLDLDLRILALVERKESRIAKCRVHRAHRDGTMEWSDRLNRPDTDAQLVMLRQRDERTGGTPQLFIDCAVFEVRCAAIEHGLDRLTRDPEKLSALCLTQHGGGSASGSGCTRSSPMPVPR